MAKFTSFSWSELPDPHKIRPKQILKAHPDVRKLMGRNPYTFLIILLAVGIQLGVAYLIHRYNAEMPWWAVLLIAYCVGAFPCHTLYVTVHECSHNLIFKNKTMNIWASIIANLAQVFPASVSFTKYHIKHHSYMGVEALDADMPYRWEARLINNHTIGKALWLLFYPVFQAMRPFRLKEIKLWDGWTLVNWLVQVVFMAAVIYFWGAKPSVYLLASFFFSIGLHPLGARWIQEHFLTHGDQETKSYYGPLNVVNLNVGYHNEHHDFPTIPWNNLPKLKAAAPEFYETLGYHTSYVKLFFQFLFDPNISVYSRMARDNRGKNRSELQKKAAMQAAVNTK